MGGLPYWLLSKHPDIKLRTSDPRFLKYVDEWFSILLPQLKPLLYINGGNIIMVQSENEYGSYAIQTGRSDTEYLLFMHDLLRKYLGQNVLIFSTDGCSGKDILNSKTPNVYSTVDFGSESSPKECFGYQNLFEMGPNVNSEYYPGWLDHWGQPHSLVNSSKVAETLDEMLKMGANVNVYMIHGGTNFGYTAGSNLAPFQPVPTSYDYDAPISEAGDLTEKYFAIKNVVHKYLSLPSIPFEKSSPKGKYGTHFMKHMGDVFHNSNLFKPEVKEAKFPMTFEELNHPYGFLIYETKIKNEFSDPALLEVKGIHDRGYVYLNNEFQGILSRMSEITSMPLSTTSGLILKIIVENQGRVCYGANINDFKGITSNVTLNGHVLKNWKHIKIHIPSKLSSEKHKKIRDKGDMTLWKGHFKIPCNETKALDTFLKVNNWKKGFAFINGINLGRYWPREGPQRTLYVPGVWIKPRCRKNTIIIFEQEQAPVNHPFIEFVPYHDINGKTPIY